MYIAIFFTSGFSYSEGILDGIYRKSLAYWFEQHSIERLKGPFAFSFLFLSWYEIFFIGTLVFHYFHIFLSYPYKFRIATLVSLIFSFVIYMFYKLSPGFQEFALWEFLKLKIPLDAFLVCFFVLQSFILPIYHKSRSENSLAFWSYLLYASFFTYSYLGEKVPWLSLYILIPGMIYLILFYNNFSKEVYSDNKRFQSAKVLLIVFYYFST